MGQEDTGSTPGLPAAVSRRRLLATAGTLGVSLSVEAQARSSRAAPRASAGSAPTLAPLATSHTGPGQIPHKPLGRTGVTVSALGMGGHHLGDPQSVDEAMSIVHEALAAGIDFFDNCWECHNGITEDRLGRALKRRRD
jgi:uncharacterized protein